MRLSLSQLSLDSFGLCLHKKLANAINIVIVWLGRRRQIGSYYCCGYGCRLFTPKHKSKQPDDTSEYNYSDALLWLQTDPVDVTRRTQSCRTLSACQRPDHVTFVCWFDESIIIRLFIFGLFCDTAVAIATAYRDIRTFVRRIIILRRVISTALYSTEQHVPRNSVQTSSLDIYIVHFLYAAAASWTHTVEHELTITNHHCSIKRRKEPTQCDDHAPR